MDSEYLANYIVCPSGHVYSRKTGQLIKPLKIDDRGYRRVRLYNGKGGWKAYRLHVLVAKLYLGNPYNLSEVNHKDKDKSNCAVDNLEWCDREHNMGHALAKGYTFLSPEGEAVEIHNLAKFCRENNLSVKHMNAVYHDKRRHHRGWRKHSRLEN